MAPVAADSINQQFGTQMPQGGHPPHHSITSSARASSVAGISRPSALAVFKLIASSKLCRLLDWQISWLSALQYLVNVESCSTIKV
jgi:hypothetical protein